MKVLMLTTFPPRRCGIGDYAADLSSALSRQQAVRLRVLTYADGSETTLSHWNGVEVVRTLGQHPVALSLAAEIDSFGPDVVHVQSSSFLHPSVVNRSLVRVCDSPILTTVHDTPSSWRLFYTIPRLRNLYRKSARVIVHSSQVQRLLEGFHAVPGRKIVKMPHGVDVARYSPDAPREAARRWCNLRSERMILFFGFLRPGKGVDTLLQAWQMLEKGMPDTILVIAGGSPSRPKRHFFNLMNEADFPSMVTGLTKSMGLADRVKFTGYVPDGQVPGLLAAADVVVLPYNGSPTQSGPMHKALGSGRPLITSKHPASIELLEDGRTAILAPPGNARALADAIQQVMTDEHLAAEIANNARAMALEQLDWTILARSTHDIYTRLIDTA